MASGPARTNDDRRRKLFVDAWTFAGLKHAELKSSGVDPHARNCWSGLPPADGVEARLLLSRIDELARGEQPDFAAAGERIKNRVLVAAEEAKKHGHLRWFTPARMWNAESFAIASALSPEQIAFAASATRIGPHSTGPRGTSGPQQPEPPRKIKTLT